MGNYFNNRKNWTPFREEGNKKRGSNQMTTLYRINNDYITKRSLTVLLLQEVMNRVRLDRLRAAVSWHKSDGAEIRLSRPAREVAAAARHRREQAHLGNW